MITGQFAQQQYNTVAAPGYCLTDPCQSKGWTAEQHLVWVWTDICPPPCLREDIRTKTASVPSDWERGRFTSRLLWKPQSGLWPPPTQPDPVITLKRWTVPLKPNDLITDFPAFLRETTKINSQLLWRRESLSSLTSSLLNFVYPDAHWACVENRKKIKTHNREGDQEQSRLDTKTHVTSINWQPHLFSVWNTLLSI